MKFQHKKLSNEVVHYFSLLFPIVWSKEWIFRYPIDLLSSINTPSINGITRVPFYVNLRNFVIVSWSRNFYKRMRLIDYHAYVVPKATNMKNVQ